MDKELTDKYTSNPDLLTATLIGRWLVHGASTLHHNLDMQTLTFPQLLHQLRIKETVPSGKDKWVQVWNAREQALFPPSPYNAFGLSKGHVVNDPMTQRDLADPMTQLDFNDPTRPNDPVDPVDPVDPSQV